VIQPSFGQLAGGSLGSFLPSLGALQLPSLLGAKSQHRHLISPILWRDWGEV